MSFRVKRERAFDKVLVSRVAHGRLISFVKSSIPSLYGRLSALKSAFWARHSDYSPPSSSRRLQRLLAQEPMGTRVVFAMDSLNANI